MSEYMVKGFNFHKKNDKDVLDHLRQQINQSKYVKDLVRRDMKNENNLDTVIEQKIKDYLKEIKLESVTSIEDLDDNVNINAIKNILEI